MLMLLEQWLPIPGHDRYEVSDWGHVRSIARPDKMLKPGRGGKGHLQVGLTHGKTRSVHQLVLEAFVGRRPLGMLALHRDGNVNNNRVENLYWGTYSDNLHDAVRHGTHHNAIKARCKRGHPLDKVALRPDGSVRQRYCSICHAEHSREWKRPRAKGGNWKLTPEQAAAIAADERSARLVAADYGITHTTVLRIRKHGYERA